MFEKKKGGRAVSPRDSWNRTGKPKGEKGEMKSGAKVWLSSGKKKEGGVAPGTQYHLIGQKKKNCSLNYSARGERKGGLWSFVGPERRGGE